MKLQTVVETKAFAAGARRLLAGDEREALVAWLAANPQAGDIVPGTGGARKVRWAAKGKGKSGGVRSITYFGGDDVPLFLLAIFGKGEKSNLTQAECNELRVILASLADEYRRGVKRYVEGRRKGPTRRA